MTGTAQDIEEILFTQDQIAARVAALGQEISRDYAGRSPLLISVLKGAVYFLTDLSREIEIPLSLDFMAITSYGSARAQSGVVRLIKDLDVEITDRHVGLVEDVIDTGLTAG